MGLRELGIQPSSPETAEIPYGDWLPDLPDLNNPGALEALNVLPAGGSYVPFCQHDPIGDPMGDTVRGATAVIRENDTVQLYAATIQGIYTRIGNTPNIKVLDAITTERYSWQFLRVNEQMVGIHPEHLPVRSTVGVADPFVTLGGTPPQAACGAQVGDFLVLGDLISDPDDGGAARPSRIRWSGYNNVDLPWVSDPATQADFQDMPPAGGRVVAISGRDIGTIFQARMISRMRYTGPPGIFDIAMAEDKRGAIARDCVVDMGPYQYFIAEDGFFVWNGTNSAPIGDNKVTKYFFKKLNYANRHRIVGVVDFVNGCIIWAFPTDSSGILNELIIYSYREDRFSHSIQTLEYLFNSAKSNVTLDELTDPIESYTETWDSPSYTGGGRMLVAGFDQNHRYGLFNGPNMAATIDTGEYSAPEGRRIFINRARPFIDLAQPVAQMQVIYRDQMIGEPLSYGDITDQEDDGTCPIIGDARYLRVRTTIPAGSAWTSASGVMIDRKTAGAF